ncbi:hypothetical protein [Corynebacterium confusum]|uniref:hypothetical protein n=1 Tax=Corynebacterium confusum TaxID=71254 RepID=UPI0025B5EEAC|nr:hypothetical protein [Corynebacterium confusum]WJY89357.1 hypothetical protein CCONF_04030 [Corynebacterium confusum]
MDVRRIWSTLTGRKGPSLARVRVDVPELAAGRLQVTTAETLVIVDIDVSTADAVREAAENAHPLLLTAGRHNATAANPDTAVYLLPVSKATLPVHDPKKGWLIPLSDQERRTVAEKLTGPGECEVSERLAFVVD